MEGFIGNFAPPSGFPIIVSPSPDSSASDVKGCTEVQTYFVDRVLNHLYSAYP